MRKRRPIKSYPLAVSVAAMLKRMTGDEVEAVANANEEGRTDTWRIVRTDPARKEYQA